MREKHSLLMRQLRRHVGTDAPITPDWSTLLDAVSDAYHQSDDDRRMLEQSLETVSREMMDRYTRLEVQRESHQSLLAQARRAEELALLNAAQVSALRAGTPHDVIVAVLTCVAALTGAYGAVAWIPGPTGWSAVHTVPSAHLEVRALLDDWTQEPRSDNWLSALDVPASHLTLHRIETGREAIERATLFVLCDAASETALGADICAMLSQQLAAALREKRMQQAYHEGTELLRAITESTQDAICAKDGDGRYLSCNAAAARLLGAGADTILGRTDAELFDAALATRERTDDLKVLTTGRPLVTEYRRITPTGDRLLLARKAPLRAVDGTVTGVAAVISDITERTLLQQRLRQAEKMESLGLMAGGIAHDFNNLLTIISGNCALLLSADFGPDERAQILGEVQQATARAADVTGQLLAFSRRQIVQPELIDLTALFAAREEVIRTLLGEAIALGMVLPDEPACIRFDPLQLEQVILNLALNARQALPRGGSVCVELAAHVLGREAASALGVAAGEYVRLTVTDDGPGMDDATRARVFEPFFLAQTAAKGGGLGLALVYGAVTAAGGAVTLASEPGRGSAFTLYIPRSTAVRLPSRTPTGTLVRHERRHSESALILLVEDERALREMVRVLLERAGYRVIVARHGEDALQRAAEQGDAIDLLLTDVVMPVMGGGELSHRFRAQHPHVPIIFMSGYSDDEIVRTGIARADALYIEKPFNADDLLAIVHEGLSSRSPRDA